MQRAVTTLCLAVMLAAAASAEEWRAIVVLQGAGVSGNLTLRQNEGGPVRIQGTVVGLAEGPHGFHIHEKGDLSAGCISTGGHFNPHKAAHGAPNAEVRHAGDLGNIVADKRGVANVDVTDAQISLCGGPSSVVGRGVVVHAGEDDLGLGGQTDSLTTGHAGGRVACGVVGLQLAPSYQTLCPQPQPQEQQSIYHEHVNPRIYENQPPQSIFYHQQPQQANAYQYQQPQSPHHYQQSPQFYYQ